MKGVINALIDSIVVRRVLKKILVQNLAGLEHHIETGERATAKTAKLPVAGVI